jgi:hypothetical protein
VLNMQLTAKQAHDTHVLNMQLRPKQTCN